MRESETAPAADIVIVGGGISGTIAATVLGRAGYQVCLIDRYATYPPDFRAEHLDGVQVNQLRRLGFLDSLTNGLPRGETVTVARSGQIIATMPTLNYGLRYETLVNRARASLPANVELIVGRVTQVDTSDTIQYVTMSDSRIVSARLVVLATGQGYAISKRLGIERRLIRRAHSLTFGFNIEPLRGKPFKRSFLIYQRERISDRIDYLAAFTIGTSTRVNLFTYRHHREPWTEAFLADPRATLAEALPGLESVLGEYRAEGSVVARPVDLYASEGHRRDGVVVIGDAFQAACPATGMGMVRLLTDIEQLAKVHVPLWLATPGMGVGKINAFYDDPIKRSCDEKALHDSEYRRSLSTATTLRWRAHRARVQAMESLSGWGRRTLAVSHPRVDAARADASLVPG